MKTTRESRVSLDAGMLPPFSTPSIILRELAADCNELEADRASLNAKLDAEMKTSAALREELAEQKQMARAYVREGVAATERAEKAERERDALAARVKELETLGLIAENDRMLLRSQIAAATSPEAVERVRKAVPDNEDRFLSEAAVVAIVTAALEVKP